MADSSEGQGFTGAGAPPPDPRFIMVPASAREAIGDLAFYLDQVRQNLLEVNVHLTGSSQTVPDVLHELRDIVQMTERATVRVLEETEALVDESRVVSRLLVKAREEMGRSGEDGGPRLGAPLVEIEALIERGNRRAMDIMAALEFQDLTSQKIQRAFDVLEEVGSRLTKIRHLMALGEPAVPEAEPLRVAEADRPDDKSGQDLADEILQRFRK
jgi:chemotaxis regulatin CheY-phosphate phosphatase CheZ